MKLGDFSLFRKIGIDLGSSRIRIWHEQTGLVIDEPSCIAIDERAEKVVAVGKEAALMTGRVSKHIHVYYPFEKGMVDDLQMARSFLAVFLQKVLPHSYFFRPIVIASIPASAQEIDRKVLTDLLYQIGAREVYLVSQPLAAAIGADVPIADASGSLILNLGAGVVEGGMISFGNSVATQYSTKAGNYFDKQIQKKIKEKFSLNISINTAQDIKHHLLSLDDNQKKLLISGQDVVSMAPKEIKISSADLSQLTEQVATIYVDLMQKLLSLVPPELTSDVIDKGILLTGGMAELDGLDTYLVGKMGVPVSVVENSDQCCIRGLSTIIEHLDLFKESLGYLDQ